MRSITPPSDVRRRSAARPLGISHPKLKEVLHQDFADCSALADALSGQDAAVFCLGAYTGAVSDAELRTITVDYTIEFARVLRGSSPERGVLVPERERRGSDGTKPDSLRALQGRGRERTARGRISSRVHLPPRIHLSRGAAERTQFQLSPAAHDLPGVSAVFPNQVIRADDLARAMVDVAVRGTSERKRGVREP